MSWRQKTIDTYNKSAKELAEYFRGIGPRVKDIEKTLELSGSPKAARVVEIGCGDGRDAKEMVKRVAEYTGFDVSSELIKIARKHVPKGKFEVADLADYKFPENLDAVFAFASLLHSPKEEVEALIGRVAKALRSGGLFCISLKKSDKYESTVKKDQFGERQFYFYSPELIEELSGNQFEVALLEFQHVANTDWFTLFLRRK